VALMIGLLSRPLSDITCAVHRCGSTRDS
jgi:hypothetical protein